MGGFFKMFFASLLSIIVFSVIVFFLLFAMIAGLATSGKPIVEKSSILVLNIGQPYLEQEVDNPLAALSSNDDLNIPGVYDVVRLIQKAKTDENIHGIYLQAGMNSNGFATCEEIRNALSDFKKSGKFLFAYGETLNQKSYYVANVADKIFVNPKGIFDWAGFSPEILFLKGTLEILDIDVSLDNGDETPDE
jgi:protease-4